jgi:phosphohistidine phosphatase
MRRLILFRHAKSDWPEGDVDDHDRSLAARGRRAAPPMGAWLAGRGFRPDLTLCSTAQRARETWALAAKAFSPSPPERFEADIYESSPETLLTLVKSVDRSVQTLMIVAHNPGLEQLAKVLATKGDPEARRLLSEKFPTAAIAVFDFPIDEWSALESGRGRLDRFVTPRGLGIGAQ